MSFIGNSLSPHVMWRFRFGKTHQTPQEPSFFSFRSVPKRLFSARSHD
jgi:hypothetical protein